MFDKVTIHWRPALLLLMVASFGTSCSTLMQAKLLSVTIYVIDENDAPIAGAIVESSNGQQSTTGADGKVKIMFSGIGIHAITVIAQDRVPATLSVTMPIDIGKTKTARLGTPVEMSVNINLSGGINMYLSNVMNSMLYPFIFQTLFSYNGYDLELTPYKPGQWTEWETGDDDATSIIKKAFLKRLDNGQEWWQLVVSNEAEDDLLMEVLFSAGRQSVRRLHQRLGSGEPEEVPVSEGWYTAPMALTPESLKGSVTDRSMSVVVPAGTYRADILEIGSPGAGLIRIWQVAGVAGGVVKIETVDADGNVVATTVLQGSGTGARTVLQSY